MKRFDKGYIYASLLTDFFGSLLILFSLSNVFLDEEVTLEQVIATIPYWVIAFAVIYLGFIVYRVLYYKTSGYELTETEMKCRFGVLFKKRSVLDYRNIHAINKKQNLLHRIFGIAILTVDSGSANTSRQAEITIIEKAKTVDALVNELNALKAGKTRAADESTEEILFSEPNSMYRFTSRNKMLYTLIQMASTAFFTALFGVFAMIVFGIAKRVLPIHTPGTWSQYFFFAILITVGGVLLLSIFSFITGILHSFVGYHKFTISKRGNDIQISFGLLERHTNTFRRDRIKAVKISQGLVQRALGFASIHLEVIGYTNDIEEDKHAEIGVLVPFCQYDKVNEIMERILPDYVPDKKQTKAVSYFPFISWFSALLILVMAIVLLQVISTMLIFNVSSSVIATVVMAIVGAGIILFAVKALQAILCFQNNGISIRNGKITAYYGGFTRNITVFNSRHLIAAENETTWLRKKAGISSLVMHLKTNDFSNEIKVHMQDDKLSEEIEQLLIL